MESKRGGGWPGNSTKPQGYEGRLRTRCGGTTARGSRVSSCDLAEGEDLGRTSEGLRAMVESEKVGEGRGRWCEPVFVSRRRVEPGIYLSDLSDSARLGQPRTSTVRPSDLQHRQQSTATMASSDRQTTGQHPAPTHSHCSATDAHLPLAADATVLILCPSLLSPLSALAPLTIQLLTPCLRLSHRRLGRHHWHASLS